MKIAIPVSSHDKHLIPAQAECLLKLGGLEEFPVIYFPTPSAKEVAYEAAEKLGAQTHVLAQDFEGGAPVACNNHFAAVVHALAAMGNTDSFLWMEADMLPAPGVHRWPDALQNDYRMRGQPFMGNIVDTPFNDNGRLAYREGDQMMMGCGVYPPHMERDERIKPLIMDLAKPAWMNPREPFDVYLRWAIKVIGRASTKLICDKWATQNYRSTAHGVYCESVDHGDRVVRERGGLVNPEAVLIHGCKDGSLAELVLGKKVSSEAKTKPWQAIAEKVEQREAGENASKAAEEAAKQTQDDDDDAFWGDESTPAPIPVTAPEPKPQAEEYVPPVVKGIPEALTKKTEEPTPVAPVKITRADIHTAMAGKKMRVADLAKKLNVPVHELVGTFPVNGFALLKAGWVQDTIPITED